MDPSASRAPQSLPPEQPAKQATATASNAELAATSSAGAQGPSATPEKPNSFIHGYLSTRYRARWSSGDDDHDVDTVLGLDFGDSNKDRVTAHLMARASADLNDASATDPFFSLEDTYDQSLTTRLYYAWADIRPESPKQADVERWRVGRQIDYLTPEFAWFDGVSAQMRPRGKQQFQLGLYGGVPVHLYESSASGDAVFGVFAQARPWKDGRVRADWMHLDDETRLAKHENDLLSLSAWQQLSPALQVEGKYTHLEEAPRDARLQANWYDQRHELTVFLSYFELLHTQKSLALEFDPFFTTLLDQFPYRQARLLVSKAVDTWLLLQGGADVRRMSDESDTGQFNHEFERSFMTATVGDVLPLELSFSLTGEIWNSPDDDIQTWVADLSRQFGKSFDASLGSYFALFKYDVFAVEERDNVRTYYISLRWKGTKASVFDVRYEFEDNDLGVFQTLRLGAKWEF